MGKERTASFICVGIDSKLQTSLGLLRGVSKRLLCRSITLECFMHLTKHPKESLYKQIRYDNFTDCNAGYFLFGREYRPDTTESELLPWLDLKYHISSSCL